MYLVGPKTVKKSGICTALHAKIKINYYPNGAFNKIFNVGRVMCTPSLNISTFFFSLECEIRVAFTPFFLAGSISRELHDNFYLQSQVHTLRRKLPMFV